MAKVFIIAEAALTWLHGGLEAAYRSIRAAKECGADAWKTQWTSDHEAMEMRRGVERGKYKRLQWGESALYVLKEYCDKVGIEFMSTVFIPQDIPTIARYVRRFKISAFESPDWEFINAHAQFTNEKFSQGVYNDNPIREIISVREEHDPDWKGSDEGLGMYTLHVVSEYPTPPEHLHLSRLFTMMDVTFPEELGRKTCRRFDGLSDHTTSTLTGAVAVGAGARIIEKHVRLADTPKDDPDWGHSLTLDLEVDYAIPYVGSDGLARIHSKSSSPFKTYVQNVREAERML